MILLIVTGCSGSGKTTLAREICKRTNAYLISMDLIRKTVIIQDTYSPDIRDTVYRIAHDKTYNIISSMNVVLDGTFYKKFLREPFYKLAKEKNCKIKIIYCHANREIRIKRVLSRNDKKFEGISRSNLYLFDKIDQNFEKFTVKELLLSKCIITYQEWCSESMIAKNDNDILIKMTTLDKMNNDLIFRLNYSNIGTIIETLPKVVECKVKQIIDSIVAKIDVFNAVAVYAVGSLARGDFSYIKDQKLLIIFSDFDFLILTNNSVDDKDVIKLQKELSTIIDYNFAEHKAFHIGLKVRSIKEINESDSFEKKAFFDCSLELATASNFSLNTVFEDKYDVKFSDFLNKIADYFFYCVLYNPNLLESKLYKGDTIRYHYLFNKTLYRIYSLYMEYSNASIGATVDIPLFKTANFLNCVSDCKQIKNGKQYPISTIDFYVKFKEFFDIIREYSINFPEIEQKYLILSKLLEPILSGGINGNILKNRINRDMLINYIRKKFEKNSIDKRDHMVHYEQLLQIQNFDG